jgi:hypothetical protein
MCLKKKVKTQKNDKAKLESLLLMFLTENSTQKFLSEKIKLEQKTLQFFSSKSTNPTPRTPAKQTITQSVHMDARNYVGLEIKLTGYRV